MKHLRLLLGLGISILCLFLAFRGVHFDQVGAALRAASYGWLVPGTALIVVSLMLRAVRWQLLFYPTTGLRYRNVFGSMNAGYLVNTILPARLGEVVRAVMLSRLESVRTAHALSTVVVERVLDMLTTIVVLGMLVPFVPLPDGSTVPLLAATGLAVVALLVIIVAGAHPRWAHALTRIVSSRLPQRYAERVHGILDSFLEGFAVLSTPRVAVRLVLYSAAIWVIIALAIYCVLFAFHLRLSPAAPMFVLALVSLSFIVPSSPGHVGVFQFVAVRALEIGFGVDAGVALSFALAAHVVSFVPPTLLGAWFVWRSGLSFSRLVSFGRGQPNGAGGDATANQPEPATALSRR
jgi:glycosyltransferase 2 family protein